MPDPLRVLARDGVHEVEIQRSRFRTTPGSPPRPAARWRPWRSARWTSSSSEHAEIRDERLLRSPRPGEVRVAGAFTEPQKPGATGIPASVR
ncbi:hypothetical protein [Pseudonocardia pini]|uniref:hypothetical protein n=1 Tax=Pseudonocardia pini TaxID=2758030 RepID=UPI0015F0E51F|nr:hypothetical protein [Pseudonocardia pini]